MRCVTRYLYGGDPSRHFIIKFVAGLLLFGAILLLVTLQNKRSSLSVDQYHHRSSHLTRLEVDAKESSQHRMLLSPPESNEGDDDKSKNCQLVAMERDQLASSLRNAVRAEDASSLNTDSQNTSRDHLLQALRWTQKKMFLLEKVNAEMLESTYGQKGENKGGGHEFAGERTRRRLTRESSMTRKERRLSLDLLAVHKDPRTVEYKDADSSSVQVVERQNDCSDAKIVRERDAIAEKYRQTLQVSRNDGMYGFDPNSPSVTREQLVEALRSTQKRVDALQNRNNNLTAIATAQNVQQQDQELPAAAVLPSLRGDGDSSSSEKLSNALKSAPYKNCDWETIHPSEDAQYEQGMDGRLSPRLDGQSQPFDIKSKFNFYICRTGDLTGAFRVEKKVHGQPCLPEENKVVFSKDESYIYDISEVFGPDEFDFLLEGPELHPLVPDMTYLGRCHYLLPYRLTIPGTYRLNVAWLRERYMGANELLEIWPPSHHDLPLGTGVLLDFGDVSKTSKALLNVRSEWQELPVCDLADPIGNHTDGRWVFLHDNPNGIWKNGIKLPASVRGAPIRMFVDVHNYIWLPRHCRYSHGIFSPAGARQCLSGKALHFRGDSHMRNLFNALGTFACGADAAFKFGSGRADVVKQCMRTNHGKCTEVAGICVVQDYFGHDAGYIAQTDLTVANFGQHGASEEHWKFGQFKYVVNKYAQRVRNQIAGIQDGRKFAGKFAWHQTNAMLFRKDEWLRGYKDWRTNTRLAMYNRYTEQLFAREVGVPIIPAYRQTKALTRHQSRDSAHFDQEVLEHSTIQMVLNLLCPLAE